MGEFALGQPVSRFEDPRLLRGGGRYVDDVVLPRMVFGHVVRSPHAHARIRSIDTLQAEAAPGVLAVLTGADWEASGWGDLPTPSGTRRGDGSPSYRVRYPALVRDRVRWVGDYVAFVVAETKYAAENAAELIAVEYEPLDRRGRRPECPARLGRRCGQCLLRPPRGRPGRRRDRPCPGRSDRPAPPRRQPRHRRDDGAARRDR
jgi:hypothetical protein